MKKKTEHKFPLFRFAAYIFICSFILTGISYSSFAVRSETSNTAKTAAFVFSTEIDNAQGFTIENIGQVINHPGGSADYSIDVKNNKGISVSQVAQKYEINLQLFGNMPVSCVLSKNEGGTAAECFKADTLSSTSAGSSGSEEGYLKGGTPETVSYVLHIKWPESENSYDYANGNVIGRAEVTFTSKQVD